MSSFSGIWVALATPFRDGEIDFPALRRLARQMTDAGVAGIVVCGSTGEAAALDETEQLAVLDAVLDAVPGAAIVMGLSGSNQREVLARLDRIQSRRVAGVLVPPPPYIRPSQAGLLGFFTTLADRAEVPVLLYNIPYRAGVGIEFDTFAALARHPRIDGVKDCGGDAMLTMRLIAETGLQVLTGEDAQLLSTLALGGAGGILASANLRPACFVRVHALAAAGRLDEARALFYRLLPLVRLMFAEPNPGPLKAGLAASGWMTNELRAPMLPASPDLAQRIARTMDAL
ncbi:4-hydroxy-tetrahydrodipicolinate synthase [Noviherbaspirillum galbum]|uniref:4-hydroxy-tetrahydrodipicolinate synthase n=1 Tax=Noviherbaspirillum galbum TaxID=2709383 RepID=A0A6B3SUU8_9BURK|nr:4-hydroxy-tetrahydrodipicolinate synthase [Noviherbaspirillum galbum]NEX64268.1 4-hydroxy-tetrahydrodipicolinate synthase [Noviherbaspirillum galbum]